MTKKIKYNVGDILEVETFAGPSIYKKVVEKVDRKSTLFKEEIRVVGFHGVFTRRKDLLALKKQCVPYNGNEKLSKCKSFTYDWQIKRVVSKKKEYRKK